jgi:hypothetical protein
VAAFKRKRSWFFENALTPATPIPPNLKLKIQPHSVVFPNYKNIFAIINFKEEDKMIKKLVIIVVIAVSFFACNNNRMNTTENAEANADSVVMPVQITVSDFLTKASELAGKEVIIKGTVSHTCKHGGKRMFIYGDNPDETVEITAGENIASFNAELEGSEVNVQGVLMELVVDEAYLNEWESEVKLESGTEHEIHDGQHSSVSADSVKIEKLEKINNYRKQIAESGKDHLSFYSIECKSFEVVQAGTVN